jgi:putative transposase
MPRTERVDIADEIYHVINRANGRMQIFNEQKDYQLFEELLTEAKAQTDMRILAYVVMPNHWHLILSPRKDGDLGIFMHWLSTTHTRRVHVATKTIGAGHLYQGRYKSFLVDSDNYLLTLIKYVERNPVRAKLVRVCENWQWGSAWRRINGNKEQKKLLDPSPTPLPHGYLRFINTSDKEDDLRDIRNAVNRGVPYGREKWVEQMITAYHLEATVRAQGRPRKNN